MSEKIIMNSEALRQYVRDNPKLVSARQAGPGLYVLKYKKSVFYNNLWDNFLEECRGTIVDENYNVVSRPFSKIYNYGIESRAPVLNPNTVVTAYRKVNGFMTAMTWYNGDVLVSTTGSTDSEYVAMAKEMMLKHMCWEDWCIELCGVSGMTLMFECVHPNDPHIIPEPAGLYFLGCRANTWDSVMSGWGVDVANQWADYGMNVLHCYAPESLVLPLRELQDTLRDCRHEGWVVYTEDGRAAKIKSPHYLVSKFVARNPRTDKLMRPGVKQSVDEEYHGLIDAIQADISAFTALDEQARLAWVREYFGAVSA